MQVCCILCYQIHGRLRPSEKGPTPSHVLESSVGPCAIVVESTPIPLPTPDLEDDPATLVSAQCSLKRGRTQARFRKKLLSDGLLQHKIFWHEHSLSISVAQP